MDYRQKVFFLFLLFMVFMNFAKGQQNCPSQNLYKTKYVTDGEDSHRLSLPLNIFITSDSIIASTDEKGIDHFLAFRIINKTCIWKADFSEGKSFYNLMLGDVRGNSYPTLNIIVTKSQPVYLELLYENGQKRIFQ